MHEAKFDIGLKALITRGKTRIGNVELTHDDGRQMATLAYNLLDKEFTPYDNAVAEVQQEGEEAARAAEEVAAAEVDCESAYGHLFGTLQARYYELTADPDADEALFERRMRRSMPMNPSDFESLGVDRTDAMMKTALDFAAEELPQDHPVLLRTTEAHVTLGQKLAVADSEEAERVAAMQKLYAARAHAKRAYIAARKVLDAALSLEETEESISQLLPPVSSIYHSSPSSNKEPAEPATPDEPVEA